MEAGAGAAAAGQRRSRRRFNVRFAPGRVKKIMQKDADVGRVVKAVPVIISRALEMFLKSFLSQTYRIMKSNHSSVLSLAHIKQCIESEKHFDFLKDLVERAMSAASQRDPMARSLWPLHRPVRRDSSVKNPPEMMEMMEVTEVTKVMEVMEVTSRFRLDSVDVEESSSSSDSELFICL